MKELNKKLNTWAGTMDVEYTHPVYGIAHCFKWLVPKLDVDYIQLSPTLIQWYCYVETGELMAEAEAENPALALCLAIERLIDSSDTTDYSWEAQGIDPK